MRALESGGQGRLPRVGGLGLLNLGLSLARWGHREEIPQGEQAGNVNPAFGERSEGLHHPPGEAAGRFELQGTVL